MHPVTNTTGYETHGIFMTSGELLANENTEKCPGYDVIISTVQWRGGNSPDDVMTAISNDCGGTHGGCYVIESPVSEETHV